jgi:hypothetical protein
VFHNFPGMQTVHLTRLFSREGLWAGMSAGVFAASSKTWQRAALPWIRASWLQAAQRGSCAALKWMPESTASSKTW